MRALAQARHRGGNVTNSLSILGQFGHQCSWVGTLGDDDASRFILDDLALNGVDASRAVRIADGVTPTSCISLSEANASRTIVHYRDLPELDAEDFSAVALDGFDWVHFEGRNPAETRRMMDRVLRECPGVTVSVELEKARPGIEALLDGPDLILASRGYVTATVVSGAPADFLHDLWGRTTAELCVVAWGADGAFWAQRAGASHSVPAAHPPTLVDTLGAGDCFNAGVIDGLLRGLDPAAAVSRAVRLAGFKCGRRGSRGLVADAALSGWLDL